MRRSVLMLVMFTTLHARADAPAHHYEVDANAVAVRDTATKLTWQRAFEPMPRQWNNANAYCKELALDGGGWRLPTLKELLTLVDPSRSTPPVLDTNAFPDTPSGIFWSSNSYVADNTYAWTVDFSQGNSAKDHAKSAAAYIRCVR